PHPADERVVETEPVSAPYKIEPGCTVTFGPGGVTIDPPVAPYATTDADTLLDAIAAIRDEYSKLRESALDQVEFNAAQSNTVEVSAYSSEAERHGAALLASTRIL